jgi:phospholipid-translocating ATPase
MVFRECSIAGTVYHGDPEEDEDFKKENSTEIVRDTSNDSSYASTSARGDDPAVPSAADATIVKLSSGVLKHFRDERLSQDLARAVEAEPDSENAAQARSLNGFFSVLALCHTVLTAVDPATGAIEYKAQSPDEAALVQAAADAGFIFRGREKEKLLLQTPFSKETERYELLNILEFTSARKRMSVIVKKLDDQDGRLFLLTKGADNVIFERLKAGGDDLKRTTEAHLEDFANAGLRTLTLAYKVIQGKSDLARAPTHLAKGFLQMMSMRPGLNAIMKPLLPWMIVKARLRRFVMRWSASCDCLVPLPLKIASRMVCQRQLLISKSRVSRFGLLLATSSRLPSVCIYPPFQESVSQTFDAAIGRSTNLIAEESNIIIIRGSDHPVQQQMIQAVEEFFPDSGILDEHGIVTCAPKSPSTESASAFPMRRLSTGVRDIVGDNNGDRTGGFVLVIDGAALDHALHDDDHKALLLRLATQCEGVICCRVSPLQKALVVKMVKDGLGVMTLAIGDGANDVSMIQAADVGVGISGEEGLQAVNSSDYAIAQVRDFTPSLMFCL